jgi:hypothetical protein
VVGDGGFVVRRASALRAALLVVALLAACSDAGGDEEDAAAPELEQADVATVDALDVELTTNLACDWLDTSSCLLPFPSSRYEVADESTATGVRLALEHAAMPVNVSGVPVSTEPFARSDGWGVGTPIMFTAEGVDPEASDFPPEDDLGRSLEDDAGTVLLDLTTGERLAHWTELDGRPSTPDEQRTTVLIRPAELLPPGHRIAVGVRTPVDGDGEDLPVSDGFRVIRDRLATGIDAIEGRRAALDATIDALDEAGLPRDELWLAWDFTVMSDENLTGDALAMRDLAFDQLGDAAPAFEITRVRTERDDGSPLPDGVAAWIDGTVDVPSFLAGEGSVGATMTRDDAGAPAISGTFAARFNCALTERQLAGDQPARPVVYGHGLLGSHEEALRGDLAFADADLMVCATPWIGMSEEDIGYAASTLQDINGFPSVADRLRQSLVNQLFLARLLAHDDGLVSAPELATPDGSPAIDTSEVFYEGHSQGGIMGFAATALSTEWTKAIIGVPGVNYSMLIPRSNNWQTYGPVIAAGYPGAVEELLVLALLQQQWDRAEGSGYAAHLTTDPLPGTPEHQVILEVALGDHQVAEVGAELGARTAGVPVWVPAFGDGRTLRTDPPFGMEVAGPGDEPSSIMVFFDSGALPAPIGSISPDRSDAWVEACAAADPDAPPCADPHEDPRRDPDVQQLRNTFFETGRIDVEAACGEDACTADPS